MEKIIESVAPIVMAICFVVGLCYMNNNLITKENEILKEEIKAYKEIINYEYDRTFKSFEEYIVYRADKILDPINIKENKYE